MKDEKTLRYEYIAHQINREDGLVNYRLTWALTLNGFLFAALGFLGGKDVPNPSILSFFHWALPLTGIFISIAGFIGVVAAQIQIEYLTQQYEEMADTRWPRPFGDKKKTYSFYIGTVPSLMPPIVLCFVWVGLLCSWR